MADLIFIGSLLCLIVTVIGYLRESGFYMWAMQLVGPEKFTRVEVSAPKSEDLAEGELLLKFLTGGLCGSDTPRYRCHYDPAAPYARQPGFPLHEIVGQVVASRSALCLKGDTVVGAIEPACGLAEFSRISDKRVVKLDPSLESSNGVVVQPVATVLSSLSRIPERVDDRAIVLGLGPLGLLFCHILHHRGYRVTGVDLVDRSDVAEAFGIDEIVSEDIRQWAPRVEGSVSAGLVVEAVGHRQELMAAAVSLASAGGHIVAFGLPEDEYVFPMRKFFRHHLSMHGGTTRDWRFFLAKSQTYVLDHPELYQVGITDRYSPFDAELAFRRHATPAVGRLKVVLSEGIPVREHLSERN